MSSTTSRLGLYKPATDGSENVNIVTDLDNNWDNLDSKVGYPVYTSGTRPSSPFSGMSIQESDTGKTYYHNGSSPASAGWVQFLSGTSGFNNAVSLSSSLVALGATTLNSTLAVAGNTTLSGNLVIGTATFRNKLSASVTVANTTTETAIATITIPANDMVAGAIYRVNARGLASVTGTPNLTLRCRIGGTSGSSLCSSGTISASSGITGHNFEVDLTFVCISTGSSGTAYGFGNFIQAVSVAGSAPFTPVIKQDGTSSATVNTTTSQDLVVTAQWGTASASNTLTSYAVVCERVA